MTEQDIDAILNAAFRKVKVDAFDPEGRMAEIMQDKSAKQEEQFFMNSGKTNLPRGIVSDVIAKQRASNA